MDEDLRRWARSLPRPGSVHTYEPRIQDVQNIIQSGWRLVATGSPAAYQDVITKLATESGIKILKAITDSLDNNVLWSGSTANFKKLAIPLFQIISHPNVQSSLLLETPLDKIYNWLYGPNGRRLISVFQTAATVLSELLSKDSEDEEYQVALLATLVVLHAVCELHQKAQVLDELPLIVETLAACVPPEHLYHESRQMLGKIQRRLDLGANIPNLSIGNIVPQTVRPSFKFLHDLPGEMSEQGPRHDNDFARIEHMKILPTAREVQSSRQEYSPSKDPDESHLPGRFSFCVPL